MYLNPIHTASIQDCSLKLKKLLEMEEEMVPVFHLFQPVGELQKNQRGEIGHHCVAATSVNWYNMMNRKQ